MRGRFRLAATMTAVAAVLGTGCAAAGPAGAGHTLLSPAPSRGANGGGHGRSDGSLSQRPPVPPPCAPNCPALYAVAALGESDAWAVGTHRPLPRGIYPLTERWDGARWRAVPCPSPGGTAEPTRSLLDAVAIDSPDDAWAVGQWSRMGYVPPTYGLIEHWNGANWTVVPDPSSGGHATDLTAVAAISPTAAWAIGVGIAGGQFVTVFMGWDGTRWRYLPSPIGNFPGGPLAGGLAAISARDIWLVGEEGTTKSAPKYHTLVERWNGSKWTIVPAPYAYKDQKPNIGLAAVSGSSSNNVWAVGSYQSGPNGGDRSPLIEHWDGTRWRLQPSPNPPGPQGLNYLDAIAAVSRTSALAVGSYDTHNASLTLPLTERWNGVHWTTVPNKLQPGLVTGYLSLTAVAAVDPRYAWMIGDGYGGSFIEKWNGISWQQLPNPNP